MDDHDLILLLNKLKQNLGQFLKKAVELFEQKWCATTFLFL